MKPSELLAKPESWTQGCRARDMSGKQVLPYDPCAVSFCIIGALQRCYGNQSVYLSSTGQKYHNAILSNITTDVSVFNDAAGRKHKEVLALLQTVEEQLEL